MDELFSETVSFSEKELFFAEPPEPKTIGSGIVKKVLGKGGAAVVYEIWNPKLEIHRAVKLWRPVNSEKTIERFETEIKITAKLHHPNIVEIHAVGEWNGLPYIEMEKIEGENLKELLKNKSTLPCVVATAISLNICRALIYAHNHEYTLANKKHKGVVHCDIKPANIMISQNGVVKLMDFGIAHPSSNTENVEKSKVTGSLQYMSPEQLESKTIDSRSDLYSLGVLLYELYSGTKAFPATTFSELIVKRNTNDFIPLSDFCKELPQKIRCIIEKSMETEPDKRFQTAHEIFDELSKIYQKQTSVLPEAIITQFVGGGKLNNIKPKLNLSHISKSVIIALVPFFLFLIIFNFANIKKFVIKKPGAISTKMVSRVADVVVPPPAAVISNPVAATASSSPKKSRKIATSSQTNRSKKIASSKPTKSDVRKVESTLAAPSQKNKAEAEPVNDGVILDELRRLVIDGDLNQADRMIKEFPLKDGEYNLIYAELLLKRGQWGAACKEAEKALRIPASRISPPEIREKVLFFKAKSLTAEFDKTKDPIKGQAAMEVWFDIKYLYRTNTSHPQYIKSDAEIRRISATL
jgi:serine/threonine protein kinase